VYARTIGPYLTKYLPGNPRIIVENMASAGSLPLLRMMESRSRQDGTVLGMFVSPAVPLSMIDPEKAVAFEKFHFIGNLARDVGVCFSWKGRGITDVRQLQGKSVTFGDTSTGGTGHVYSSILSHVYGSNVKHILGYGTTQEVRLALERGEVEANCTGFISLEASMSDRIQIFAKFGTMDLPGLENVTGIYELVQSEEEKRAVAFLLSFLDFTRPIITTPGTPAPRVAALRAAFDKAIEDPGFLADAHAQRIAISANDGLWLEAKVKDVRSTQPEIVALARDISD